MNVIYYQSPNGNFGDDLNVVLWRSVLPAACFEVDDAVLLGIGSILRDEFLSEDLTRGKRVFVLGSGAGTGPLPRLWPNPNWLMLAVRGPLTARLVGLPGTEVTDSAALIATTPELKPKPGARGEIAFMPHYNSVLYSQWPNICAEAGLTYIDAHWPVEKVIEHMGRAHLIVTEAMHGAIVADALRIPWVPVVCSPEIAPFKWVDWTRSLELDYRPISLPASSAWEALKHIKLRMMNGARGLAVLSDSDEDLLRDFHRRYAGLSGPQVHKRLLGEGQSGPLQKLTAPFDAMFFDRAADALLAASRAHPYLSKRSVFTDRVERLQEAVATLQRELVGSMH